MIIECKRCKKTWEYKGTKRSTPEIPNYVSCPNCRANVKVPVAGKVLA